MTNRPLKHRVLRRTLARYGIAEVPTRGKGSHRMFEGVVERRKQRYPVACHSDNHQHSAAVIASVRRRFNLTPDHGVTDAMFYKDRT